MHSIRILSVFLFAFTGVHAAIPSAAPTDAAGYYAAARGVSYAPIERLTLDLGYRYVDTGKSQSGWNGFTNARGLQDEMMRADVTSSEVYLGACYRF